MAYVVYNRTTWKIVRKADRSDAVFTNERAAKAFRTRFIRTTDVFGEPLQPDNFVIDTYENYNANEPMVDTYNILNPDAGTFKIGMRYKNTSADPATESYHSM